MQIGFFDFIISLGASPITLITVLLTLGVIFVNGWTDAPNAIATCVCTGALNMRKAVLLAAVFNFLGALIMGLINTKVAKTIYTMFDFGTSSSSVAALCAAMFAIIVWATAAWWFGIPTSESHALIAGVGGAAIAIGGVNALDAEGWLKVLNGIILSVGIGFILGYAFAKIIKIISPNPSKNDLFYKNAQIVGAAAMSFMHGAQDSQKFIGVMLLGIALNSGNDPETISSIPIWLMLLCSLVISLGTALGGGRIIKAVGEDMVSIEKYQGFCADMAGAISLFFSSVLGLPVSTTHAKTTAIMGVGAAKSKAEVNWKIAFEMITAWFLTFPGCMLVSYIMAKIFILIT